MDTFRTTDGRDVMLGDGMPRPRRSGMVLLSGEGLPTLACVGSPELEPERWLEIQNRSGTNYDTVTRVNIGVVSLSSSKGRGDSLSIQGLGLAGTGSGGSPGPGEMVEGTHDDLRETTVWLMSTGTGRFMAALPREVDEEDLLAFMAEGIDGAFVLEQVSAGTTTAADPIPAPGRRVMTEVLLATETTPRP